MGYKVFLSGNLRLCLFEHSEEAVVQNFLDLSWIFQIKRPERLQIKITLALCVPARPDLYHHARLIWGYLTVPGRILAGSSSSSRTSGPAYPGRPTREGPTREYRVASPRHLPGKTAPGAVGPAASQLRRALNPPQHRAWNPPT